MNTGRVRYALHDGVYLLAFDGDVRLDLGTRLDAFIDLLRADTRLQGVLVDLRAAEHLDSTSLGLLAKLSLMCRDQSIRRPSLCCPQQGMRNYLASIGFDDLFDRCDEAELCNEPSPDRELPRAGTDERAVHDKVLEAHRVLMALNEHNYLEFKDLVEALEREQPSASS